MKQHSGCPHPATLLFEALVFSFPSSFTSRGTSLALTTSRNLFSISCELRNQLFLRKSLISSCGLATLISMASTCYPPIANNYPYGSIFDLGVQSSTPPASSDVQPLDFAVHYTAYGGKAGIDDHLPMGRLSPVRWHGQTLQRRGLRLSQAFSAASGAGS
jgi:hypothetical protein